MSQSPPKCIVLGSMKPFGEGEPGSLGQGFAEYADIRNPIYQQVFYFQYFSSQYLSCFTFLYSNTLLFIFSNILLMESIRDPVFFWIVAHIMEH